MIASDQTTATADEVAWARRTLAAVLRSSGSYIKLQQALALIELNLTGGAAPEDLREKALALAACPEPQRHKEAIAILEKLLPSQVGNEGLQLTLAQLYLVENDWPHAEKLLRSLAAGHEQDPRYIAIYVARLLQRQETDEAELWLHRLQQLAPRDFATASLTAEALVQRNSVDLAIQTLRDSLAGAKLSATDSVKQMRLTAIRLEELARSQTGPDRSVAAGKLLAEAESMYRKYVKEMPDQQLVLAAFLGRRGRFDEAATLVEAAQPTADPIALAQACVDLCESGMGRRGADERLEKILHAALDRHSNTMELQLALADLRIRQDRFDEAVGIYRKVLERDGSNIVAMNNLANLLALEKKQLDEALRLVNAAIAAAGPLPTLLDSRAAVLLALGKPQDALTDLELAIGGEVRPNRQFHLALAYFKLGQTPAATQSLDKARQLGLKPEDLNSLERPVYEQLIAELQRRGG